MIKYQISLFDKESLFVGIYVGMFIGALIMAITYYATLDYNRDIQNYCIAKNTKNLNN